MFLAIVEVTLDDRALTFTVTDQKGKILKKNNREMRL